MVSIPELEKFLYSYKYYAREILIAKEKIEQNREMIGMPISGVTYDGMPKGSGVGDRVANLAIKFIDNERDLEQRCKKAQARMEDIMEVIRLLPEKDDQQIFELRYTLSATWEDIGKRFHLSESSVRRRCAAGLKQLSRDKRASKIIDTKEKPQDK